MQRSAMRAALVAATGVSLAFTAPAEAAAEAARFQVKALATAVLPDGGIDRVKADAIGLPAGSQTRLNDNYVPTAAVEYFLAPQVSVETICCFTQHHLNGAGPLAGAEVVDHILVLPATVTLKYHFGRPGKVRPYIGVGPSLYVYFGEKPGATAQALGAAKVELSNELGATAQAGIDIPVGEGGMIVSLDAKRTWMGTTARFRTAAGATALVTKHRIDPWILSAGVGFRF